MNLLDKSPRPVRRTGHGNRGLLAAGLFLFVVVMTARAGVAITRGSYHGWSDVLLLRNGQAEVVVVPSIGRVLQFALKGEEGVFWENRALDGQLADIRLPVWAARDWVNFGGDKAWPSPEGEWSHFTGRKGWRPPPGFDGMGADITIKGSTVLLTSPVDPFYGVQVRRWVRLHSSKPVLTITTEFKLVQGEPARLGIWVVTQLKHPLGIFAAEPKRPITPAGYVLLGHDLPPSLTVSNRLLALTRSLTNAYKIGLASERLLWVGEKQTLRIDSVRRGGAEYPDYGSNNEVYTSPDPLPYIELETLGPLQAMKQGTRITQENVYTLARRRLSTPLAEAKASLR